MTDWRNCVVSDLNHYPGFNLQPHLEADEKLATMSVPFLIAHAMDCNTSPGRIERLVQAMKAGVKLEPPYIMATRDGLFYDVNDGNCRLRASRKLGYTAVPVRIRFVQSWGSINCCRH